MTALGLIVAVAAGGNTGFSLKDLLTFAGILATGALGMWTARTSRSTNRDSIEAQAYARADAVSGGAISRLEAEVKRLGEDAERRDVRHTNELAHRDRKIDELELRAARQDRRIGQLVQAIRDAGGVIPPETAA